MDDLLADFLTETQERLGALVRLERAPEDAATLAEVFRIVHTIKGTCGFLGLPRMEAVAHAGENVLGLSGWLVPLAGERGAYGRPPATALAG